MTSTDTSNFLIAEAQLALEQARKEKSHRTRTLGSPIQLSGKALAISIIGNYAWIAENTTVARKIDIETGSTLQIYRGHSGPLTSLAFTTTRESGCDDQSILITGSWDQTIKLWDTKTRNLISSTDAHTDFVKCLFVLPALKLLVSGGSDKTIRFWDLSDVRQSEPLTSVGFISSHVRPIECLDGEVLSDTSAILYTADTMGIIKKWQLTKEGGVSPRWRGTLFEEYNHHRTRINEMLHGNDQLWTASSDGTVQVLSCTTPSSTHLYTIPHPLAVRAILPLSLTGLAEPYLITAAGDVIRSYDVSSLEEPELLGAIDAHWHDVTALHLWSRRYTDNDGKICVEPWVISTSLDSTIRKWKLIELLKMTPVVHVNTTALPKQGVQSEITDDEERELAELLDME